MKKALLPSIFFLLLWFAPVTVWSQANTVETPKKTEATFDLNKTANSSSPLQIVVLLTLLSFIPAILISMTCFTRLIVVFHFLRQALGTQEAPNNQILLGLALFITLFVMSPTFKQIYDVAYKPMTDGTISQSEALEKGLVPLRVYMLKHTREKDLALFLRLSKGPRPNTADDVPTTALIPAYMISELKTAFQIGFVLFLPFLIIDLAVSSVLLSMGMMQLPPVIVSLPFKILLFVMVDGWYLIVTSLVKSVL
ncbi:MAG TPA: flagellar type III secretion system pore protein FliP [Pyrinomonadaceae bacterium]|nr:flagellar type III secretion system pore protein FliP [Pyrinomonadaceae bacterium]